MAALVHRLQHGRPRDLAEVFQAFAPLLVIPFLAALGPWLRRGGDALSAARAADRASGGAERILTAADAEARGERGPFLTLVARQARERLATLPPHRSASRFRTPSPWLALLGLGLALALLFVPAAGRGLLGEPDPSRAAKDLAAAGGIGGEEGDTEGAPKADGFGAKVRFEAETDARLYALGQEINLTLRLAPGEPMPDGVRLETVLILDGTTRLPLELDWTLPTSPGEELTATVPLRDRLKEVGKYERGILTIESYAWPREDRPDLRGKAEANRVIIQISENQETARTRTPQSAKKEKRPDRQPKPEKKKDERPDEAPQKKQPRPDPERPGDQRGAPPPPKDIEAKKHALEPLFSGDQTKKREKRVYDREEIPARPDDPPPTAGARERGYRPAPEVEILKGDVPPRDRARVRRYFDRLRPGGGEK
ncbi:MAG: hypothetical protein R3F20_18590 [Planctomycetota bacterium]